MQQGVIRIEYEIKQVAADIRGGTRDANRDGELGDRYWATLDTQRVDLRGLDLSPDPVRDREGACEITAGKQDQELVSTVASVTTNEIVSTCPLLQHCGHGLQDGISGGVAVGIVDLFEVIKVEEEQAGCAALCEVASEGLRGQVVPGFSIQQAGESVDGRTVPERLSARNASVNRIIVLVLGIDGTALLGS